MGIASSHSPSCWFHGRSPVPPTLFGADPIILRNASIRQRTYRASPLTSPRRHPLGPRHGDGPSSRWKAPSNSIAPSATSRSSRPSCGPHARAARYASLRACEKIYCARDSRSGGARNPHVFQHTLRFLRSGGTRPPFARDDFFTSSQHIPDVKPLLRGGSGGYGGDIREDSFVAIVLSFAGSMKMPARPWGTVVASLLEPSAPPGCRGELFDVARAAAIP